MNTRSQSNRSESGIGESERPSARIQVAGFHRIYEESPRSPSTAITAATSIPKGRRIEHSPPPHSSRMPPPPAPLAPSTQQQDVVTPARRPTSPASSEHTIRSRRSSVGTTARVRMAEYEAEKEMAELEERRIQMKKTLIKKRLEAEISAIEAEDDKSSIGDNDRVRDWIDRSQADQQRREAEQPPPAIEERGEDKTRRKGIEQLASALEKMIQTRPPPRQTTELPPFSGSIMEWLPFKAAMEDSTRLYKFSATENLLRLRNSLRGEARETVLSQLYTSTQPDLVMKTLEMKYGRPEYIIDRAMEDLKRLPKVGNSSSELNELAIKLQNIVYTMKSVDRRGYLQNPLLIRDVMDKLSPHLVSKWAEYAVTNEARIANDNEITILAEFLMTEADRILRYTHTARHSYAGPLRGERPIRRIAPREKVYSTSESTYEERTISCLRCHSTGHRTPECPKLKELTINQRWNWAKEQRICFKCMAKKHNRFTCKAKLCGINGCKFQHHAILHKELNKEPSKEDKPTDSADQSAPAAVMNVTSRFTPRGVLLKTCRVKISGPRGELTTDALLDEGSTVTLIEEDIAKMIANEGPKRSLNIRGINENRQINSGTIQMHIQGLQENKSHIVTARTVKGLHLHQQRVPDDLERYPHMRDIVKRISYEEAKPQILIGADNWHLIVSRQLRIGKRNEPAASWTKLGWVIHGSVPNKVLVENEEAVLHVHLQSSDMRLERLIEKHFEVDSLGVTLKNRISEKDQRAQRIFEATIKRNGSHFEVGLPWRSDNPTLPDNRDYAYKRLETLEKKMAKQPIFKREYEAQVSNLVNKGYAVRCDGSEEKSNIKWYLPHFAVFNINKPGKLRMVFDAAARAHGVSLNDCLLEGPDLLASLTKILFGFRERKIAVTADIEEMFLRVKIRPEDQPAQMFLWRTNSDELPQRFKMTSMIFGATSSPYLAHSVRNYNATEHEQEYPLAAQAIRDRHYMDDYLDSFNSEKEAIQMTKDVIYIHEQASFNLRGWNSNSTAVLDTIPEAKRSTHVNVRLTTGLTEKTLGLRWSPREDTIGFNTEIKRVPTEVKHQQRAPTKREALSAVMSIYDPLGLISHYTIIGKIILQRLWSKKIGWDEELPTDEAEEFGAWVAGLQDISALALPRCYSCKMTPESELQLHVFNDASEQAYATTAYWRISHPDGTIETIQVMGRAKVAPLRMLTIPRLELQAAVIGSRMASTILNEHTWKPTRTYMWTDSKTVIHWIRNETKKYTPFVSHRLAEISELSRKEDWRWVPTSENAADDATRINSNKISGSDRWSLGPTFLKAPIQEWPYENSDDTPTEETVYTIEPESKLYTNGALPDINRFSTYEKLIRTTARVRLFTLKLKAKRKELPLEVSHIKEAESRWYQRAQQDCFYEDFNRLTSGHALSARSKLSKLDPVIEEGVIKARGRIGASRLSSHSNRPIILDGRHPFTRLLITKYHRNAGHANNERVVNELRQKYIILRLRPTVRQIARECQLCKIRKATPYLPTRGNLPEARVNPGHRPFSYCGVDYFGPMSVTIGRRREKRWCALFTCLTTRAVHLELVTSLSTDSAIMAFRRMAARRGWPHTVYSDNATNFRGADNELRDAYEKWGPALKDFGLLHDTDWRFIPPGAPHMGGAWERLVRSVKTALTAALKEKSPREEVLQTVLTEAEYSINARPLTHVSVDPEDEEAITPNHFLLGTSTGLPLTGPCEEADRQTWRKAQAIADQFWRRWTKEYLPTLIPRGQRANTTRQLQIGDLVVIIDGALPRNTWPRGVIERIHPGADGVIRSADVRTKGGTFRRPTVKIAVLHVEEAAKDLRRGEDVTDG